MSRTKFFHRFRDEAEPGKPPTDWSVKRAALVDGDKVLLSHTHLWLRRIPGHCQPKQLCRQYPRIANAIAECWDDSTLGDRLLVDLMVDTRGNRAGFADRIVDELQVLRQLREYSNTRVRISERVRQALSKLTGFRATQF
jgi:hypothetical protein